MMHAPLLAKQRCENPNVKLKRIYQAQNQAIQQRI